MPFLWRGCTKALTSSRRLRLATGPEGCTADDALSSRSRSSRRPYRRGWGWRPADTRIALTGVPYAVEPALRRLLDTLHPLSDAELEALMREKVITG